MNHRERIGQRLAEFRQANGITQEQLAEKAGLDRANVSKIENGRYNVSIDILQRICDALSVELTLTDKAAD